MIYRPVKFWILSLRYQCEYFKKQNINVSNVNRVGWLCFLLFCFCLQDGCLMIPF